MKEIINGMLYDTATAKHLGDWQSSPNSADPDYCVLALYRKTNGEFFLTCCGSGKERYICYVSDNCFGRPKHILPLMMKAQEAVAATGVEFSEYIEKLILADSQSA